MSNFPNDYDDDITLPPVYNNITEIGSDAINSLREAVFNIENNIGLNSQGTQASLNERVSISINPDGTIKSSSLDGLGLVSLPITDEEIDQNAKILESKLKLDYKTIDLYNYIRDLASDVDKTMGWLSVTGSKLDPHIFGLSYNHVMNHILVHSDSNYFLKNKYNTYRNNDDLYELVNDMNTELLDHQWSDSLPYGSGSVTTRNGSTYPSHYGHTASGVFLQTDRFISIPQTTTDLQLFAEYIDSSSTFLYGTRYQNLYSNGISRVSRSSSLLIDGYGQAIVPETTVTTYLSSANFPNDSVEDGDDIIRFYPGTAEVASNVFVEQFSLVKPGDIVRVNYGGVQTSYVIKNKRYEENGVNSTFIVRIFGKNLSATTAGVARIERSLVNDNKQGVLAVSAVNNNLSPSLLIGDPRGAQTTGNGFNASQFDSSHYMLYLALFDTGNLDDGYTILPGIDVTGNLGATPGRYTLDSIVEATNTILRTSGYNYRFSAFSNRGEFGIMLSDTIGNASFSIINAAVSDTGVPSEIETNVSFPNNVVGVFSDPGTTPADPLGFGINGSSSASPPYMGTYASAGAAANPTKVFVPLNRNNYYVDGVERDRSALEVGQAQDDNGDGYWAAIVENVLVGATVVPTYTISGNLSQTGLAVGKTIVIKDTYSGKLINSGRYVIKTCSFECSEDNITKLTVIDSIHGLSYTPPTEIPISDGYEVSVYFDSDSLGFNSQSVGDQETLSPLFKRNFEIFTDSVGKTFSHERARFYLNSTLNESWITLRTNNNSSKIDMTEVSPKLKGFTLDGVNKITLRVNSYNSDTGIIDLNLCKWDGNISSYEGPSTVGKIGTKLRVYDHTYIDYIDFELSYSANLSDIVSPEYIDIQLFNSLRVNDQMMPIALCQLNTSTNTISRIRDVRQFGVTSEKDFSTSAIDFITSGDRHLHSNGVIRGFELEVPISPATNPNNNSIFFTGGAALVNGSIVQMNNELVTIPFLLKRFNLVDETYININMSWILCVTNSGEYKIVALSTSETEDITSVFNLINAQIYNIESSTLTNIINNRKDLTPLYIVSGAIDQNLVTMNISLKDVRKYINDSDSSLPLTYTSGNAQGNFRSFESAFMWLNYNADYNGTLNIRGGSETLSKPVLLSSDSNIVVDGSGSSELTLTSTLNLGSNVTLKNLTINAGSGLLIVNPNSDNIIFENCIINVEDTPMSFNGCDNLTIKKCSFIISNPAGTYAFPFSLCTNVKITESSFNTSWDSSPPGNTLLFKSSSDILVDNCLISGEFQMAIQLQDTNDIKILNSTFNGDLDPSGMTFDASATYDLNEVVYNSSSDIYTNSGRGWIYSNVTSTLERLEIIGNTFNNASILQRLMFINIELPAPGTKIVKAIIDNNKFYDNNLANLSRKPVVAIINNSYEETITSINPQALNCSISNNYTNSNQGILVTSALISGEMKYPGLVTNNFKIQSNDCGTIGYWISSGSKRISGGSSNTDDHEIRSSSLVINNNNCLLITNLDATGSRFYQSNGSDRLSNYASGSVLIDGNASSWITVGMSREQGSSLTIVNNTLTGYTSQHLSSYSTGISVGSSVAGYSAIGVVGDPWLVNPSQTPSESNYNICVISNNNASNGYYISNGTLFDASYSNGLITTNIPATITGNILKGKTGSLIKLTGEGGVVTGNSLYREDSSISYYISTEPSNDPSKGIIKNNFFDNWTTDGSSEDVVYIGANASQWVITENINQTAYAMMSMTNGNHFNQNDEGGFQYYDWEVTVDNEKLIQPAKTADNLTETDSFSSPVMRVKNSYLSGSGFNRPQTFSWIGDVSSVLPQGVKLLSCKIGMRLFEGAFRTANNGGYDSKFALNFYKNDGYVPIKDNWNLDSFSSATSKDTNQDSLGTIYISGDDVNGAFPNTFEGGGNINDAFITGKDFNISVSFVAVYRAVLQDPIEFLISPIIIKYRW